MVLVSEKMFISCTVKYAARGAPYAKKRTHVSHDIQMTRHGHNNHGQARTAVENGPSLLS